MSRRTGVALGLVGCGSTDVWLPSVSVGGGGGRGARAACLDLYLALRSPIGFVDCFDQWRGRDGFAGNANRPMGFGGLPYLMARPPIGEGG